MKFINRAITLIFLVAVLLTSCNSSTAYPAMSPTDEGEKAMSAVKMAVVETQTAIPTATPVPPTVAWPISLTPTEVPPGAYSNNYAPPPGKLDYAKTILRKHYALFPYVDKEKGSYALEYYGCAETDDFGGSIAYSVTIPLETVDNAFIEYFKNNKWESVEAIEGVESGISTVKYEVYRLSTADIPAFEKLQVVLYDYTPFLADGNVQTKIRSNFTRIENEEYFSPDVTLANYPCRLWFAFNSGW